MSSEEWLSPMISNKHAVETSHYAHRVFHTLTTNGVIDSLGHPDTTKIDKNLVNKIGIISVGKQRELVNMMFFWEEELMRWRLLDEEEDEVKSALTADGMDDDTRAALRDALRVIEAKKRIAPSQRMQDGTLKTAQEHPPEYKE